MSVEKKIDKFINELGTPHSEFEEDYTDYNELKTIADELDDTWERYFEILDNMPGGTTQQIMQIDKAWKVLKKFCNAYIVKARLT